MVLVRYSRSPIASGEKGRSVHSREMKPSRSTSTIQCSHDRANVGSFKALVRFVAGSFWVIEIVLRRR